MTHYLLNLTRQFTDNRFDNPFLYDLYRKEDLALVHTRTGTIASKIDRAFLEIMRSRLTFRESEWRLIVLVELFDENMGGSSNFIAYLRWIEEGLVNRLRENGWKGPQQILLIWPDKEIAEDFELGLRKYEKGLLLDKHGFPPSGEWDSLPDFASSMESIWKTATPLFIGKNPDTLSVTDRRKVEKSFQQLEVKLNHYLTTIEKIPLHSKRTEITYFQSDLFKEMKTALQTDLDKIKTKPSLWGNFKPDHWILETFSNHFGLTSVIRKGKTAFFRMDTSRWPDSQIDLFLLLRFIVEVPNFRTISERNSCVYLMRMGKKQETTIQRISDYIEGLNFVENEIVGWRGKVEQEPVTIIQYEAPDFLRAKNDELTDVTVNRFHVEPFKARGSLSRFDDWTNRIALGLDDMQKSLVPVVRETYRVNSQLPFGETELTMTETEWERKRNDLEEDYQRRRNLIRNTINVDFASAFRGEIPPYRERLDSLLKIRPKSLLFICAILFGILLLNQPYFTGYGFETSAATMSLLVVIGAVSTIAAAFIILWRWYVKPVRQLTEEAYGVARQAKINGMDEFNNQQDYIRRILAVRVTRKNIRAIDHKLDELRMSKQKIEYILREIEQHRGLMSNMITDMKLKLKDSGQGFRGSITQNHTLEKPFRTMDFAGFFSNGQPPKNFTMNVNGTPSGEKSPAGDWVKDLELINDDLFRAD